MKWLLMCVSFFCASALAAPAPVELLAIEGAIGPASADYVHRGLERAARAGAQLLVLRLDTPGGLDTSMRAIVKDILASPVPVAVFVAPSGARAASAGTFILYAAHIAAMAPGTNLGAASPVALGGIGDGKSKDGKGEDAGSTMLHKAKEDAAAYIRGLAQLRGRNADWAERAVREAVSLPADDALKLHVADLLAADVPQLLERVNGRILDLNNKKVTLATRDAPTVEFVPDWRMRFLAFITDPSIAYGMLLLGVYAVFFELMNPGFALPGVTGAIAIVLALYALHMLPVSYAGLTLLLLGLALMGAEAFFPAYGSLGAGGAVAFVVGSVMLIDTDLPGYGVPLPLVLGLAGASAAFLIGLGTFALRGQRRAVVSGRESLVGATGEVLHDLDSEGWARVQGETWRVKSAAPLKAGEQVKVSALDGLILQVEKKQPNGA